MGRGSARELADATGEANEPSLRVTFDHRIRLDFHGARIITSDAGLPAYCEVGETEEVGYAIRLSAKNRVLQERIAIC